MWVKCDFECAGKKQQLIHHNASVGYSYCFCSGVDKSCLTGKIGETQGSGGSAVLLCCPNKVHVRMYKHKTQRDKKDCTKCSYHFQSFEKLNNFSHFSFLYHHYFLKYVAVLSPSWLPPLFLQHVSVFEWVMWMQQEESVVYLYCKTSPRATLAAEAS